MSISNFVWNKDGMSIAVVIYVSHHHAGYFENKCWICQYVSICYSSNITQMFFLKSLISVMHIKMTFYSLMHDTEIYSGNSEIQYRCSAD